MMKLRQKNETEIVSMRFDKMELGAIFDISESSEAPRLAIKIDTYEALILPEGYKIDVDYNPYCALVKLECEWEYLKKN